MTREETIKVLAILKAAYPASYRNMTKDEANGTVAIWAAQFAREPVQVVMLAVQKLISKSTFPPTISEVKSQMRGLYWEAWQDVAMHENGCRPLDEQRLEAMRTIVKSCERYTSNSNEPTLGELLGGVQKYLTDGKG